MSSTYTTLYSTLAIRPACLYLTGKKVLRDIIDLLANDFFVNAFMRYY